MKSKHYYMVADTRLDNRLEVKKMLGITSNETFARMRKSGFIKKVELTDSDRVDDLQGLKSTKANGNKR